MMILLNILLLLTCVYADSPNKTCSICIVDSLCGDDYVHFNISVSNECKNPMNLDYHYDTDINSEKHYSNATIDCRDCYFDLMIDYIRDAWDYTLTLQSSKSTALCSVHIAHCGGKASPLLWYIVAGLSGLFVVLGAVLWIVRYYRTSQPIKSKEKTTHVLAVNG